MCARAALLLALLLQGCAFTPPRDTDPIRNEVMISVLAQVGKEYVYGGAGPDTFDCSGLVQYAFALSGVQLPRSTQEQRDAGKKIDFDEVRPGDLLFYKFSNWFGVDHVAVYVGDGHAVHAPANGRQVIVTDITGAYWRKNFVEAVDVLD
jgi:cell wall-associated NlpC family hydrolase